MAGPDGTNGRNAKKQPQITVAFFFCRANRKAAKNRPHEREMQSRSDTPPEKEHARPTPKNAGAEARKATDHHKRKTGRPPDGRSQSPHARATANAPDHPAGPAGHLRGGRFPCCLRSARRRAPSPPRPRHQCRPRPGIAAQPDSAKNTNFAKWRKMP